MIELGITGRQEEIVTVDKTAAVRAVGALDIYATPCVITLMEKTAFLSMIPYLEEGDATVGISIQMDHVSPTPVGIKVWAESKLIAIDRRKLTFEIFAYDEYGEIGHAIHDRFIVNEKKFVEKAMSKKR